MSVRRVFIKEKVPRIFFGRSDGQWGRGHRLTLYAHARPARTGWGADLHPPRHSSPSSSLNHPASHSRPPRRHKVAKSIEIIVLDRREPGLPFANQFLGIWCVSSLDRDTLVSSNVYGTHPPTTAFSGPVVIYQLYPGNHLVISHVLQCFERLRYNVRELLPWTESAASVLTTARWFEHIQYR